MRQKNKLTKEDVEKFNVLTEEQINKLNFHELCLYLGLLDEMENVLERSNS